tara:strand:+ start:359 stop:553 length:195 start_codon:yes stop_codon:yes gene_type:complete
MSGYVSEDGLGFIPLIICALILGSLIQFRPVTGVQCVTVTGIKAAPMQNGRQNFTYYEKEVCDE